MKELDDLRTKAEEMVEVLRSCSNTTRTRRPTFAPPLLLGEELLVLLYELDWLGADQLAVARLWARFTDPRRRKVKCEGFELRAGQAHNGRTICTAHYFDKGQVLANLNRLLAEARSDHMVTQLDDALRVTEARTGGWSFGPHWTRYRHNGRDVLPQVRRAVELGQARLMNFAGAPGKQMRAAGKYCGHCCCCGKALTDPHSIELGIGPECRRKFNVPVAQAIGAWIIGGTDAPAAA